VRVLLANKISTFRWHVSLVLRSLNVSKVVPLQLTQLITKETIFGPFHFLSWVLVYRSDDGPKIGRKFLSWVLIFRSNDSPKMGRNFLLWVLIHRPHDGPKMAQNIRGFSYTVLTMARKWPGTFVGSDIQIWWWPENGSKLVTFPINCCAWQNSFGYIYLKFLFTLRL